MEIQTIGIVGFGHFGEFLARLAERFAPGVTVRIYSSRVPLGGDRFGTLAAVAQSDILFLAVPIAAFEETLNRVVPLLGEHTVIVDVATVKVHTVALLRKLGTGVRWVATHPMFGPESYAKSEGDVSRLRVVVSDYVLDAESYAAALALLRGWGFSVVEMDAAVHDRRLAGSLFLTHFVGQIIHRAGFDRTEIDSLSFGFLMDAMESVRHDTKLFQDVFRFNPFCKEVLDRFEVSERDVRILLENSTR